MDKMYSYTVAEHTFGVVLPDFLDENEVLRPYLPFRESDTAVSPLFTLRIEFVERSGKLPIGEKVECFNDEAPFMWLFKAGEMTDVVRTLGSLGPYVFGFSNTKSHSECYLFTSAKGNDALVFLPSALLDKDGGVTGRALGVLEFVLTNCMMLLFTGCTAPYDTLMVHSSVVEHQGRGYMFLGRSGTGKSTHSSLWLKHIEGTELMNDDNPAIRIVHGVPTVFGTPWSGKTPCYKNVSAPIGGIVRIVQAPHNKITGLNLLNALAALLPSCSCMKWDHQAVTDLHRTLEKVITATPLYMLECLPDEEAARLCHDTVVK